MRSSPTAQPSDTPGDPMAEFVAQYSFQLDDFQLEAIDALSRGKSVLVAAPTGTGKTVIAEFGVFLAHRAGFKAFYTTPIKALSNQKYRDFHAVYGDDVGLLTGDLVINSEAPLLVMTTEVLRNMLVQEGRAPNDLGVVVFDEVHYVGDPERGTAWEEAILLAPPHLPLVCLSATVPNAGEVAAWIRASHGELECIEHNERAVPLEHFYFVDGKATLLIDSLGRPTNALRGVGGELSRRIGRGDPPFRPPRKQGGELGSLPPRLRGGQRGDSDSEPRKEAEPWEVVRHLEREQLTPAIYFLFGRRACEIAAESCLVLPAAPHGQDLVHEARARLSELPPEDRRLRQVSLLLRLLSRGIAVHHAGLLPVVKILVEEFFGSGRLRAVFATDTLAVGINMPARTVVIGEMIKFDGQQRRPLIANEYRQLVGRAGRRGIDVRGVALILYSPWVRVEDALQIASGELLPLESAFRPSYSTAANLWRQPGDEERLADLYARSLRRFQHDVRLEELTIRYEAANVRFHELAERSAGDPEAWRQAHALAALEEEQRAARAQATIEARRVVQGIGRVMERFGYLSVRRPTWKAEYLRRIFDNNALTLSELLVGRHLEGLESAEIAEALSWFGWDREVQIRPLPLTTRLHRLREELDAMQGAVLAEERRAGLDISRPLPIDLRGAALAWAEGRTLSEISARTNIAEGDLVGLLQKTLDLLGQLRTAASRVTRPARRGSSPYDSAAFLDRLRQADALLRRGVVEASYRWAIGGPPEGESVVDDWEPEPFEPTQPFRRRRPMVRGVRRRPSRRGR